MPGSPAGPRLSRRDLLGALLKGTTAASLLPVLGRLVPLSGGTPVPELAPAALGASARAPARLAAVRGGTDQLGSQAFLSRPDLHPPVVTLDAGPGPGSAPGYVLTDSHAGPAHQGPLMVGPDGEVVWFLDLSPGKDTAARAFNFQVQSLRGEPVLTWFQGAVVNAHGQGHYEIWDSTYTKVTEVHGRNGYQGDLHEFVITEAGTALFTCYGQGKADLSRFGGKAGGAYYYGVVQEVDIRTGRLLFEWRSDEHVPLEESYNKLKGDYPPWDYFHINSICVDPADQNLIVSGRNTWAFYKLDRKSGRVIWRLGGKSNGFKADSGAHFAFQHDVRRYADGTVSLFDNEGGPPVEASQSRALVLAVDEKARTSTSLRQYLHKPTVLSEALGSLQRLGDKHVFVGWGESSYFSEYGPTGSVLLDGHLTKGTESYRAFKQNWVGRPVGRPAIAVRRHGRSATIYASFNGCTALGGWSIFGGPAQDKLSLLGQAAQLGFETAISVPSAPEYLAVEAIGLDGRLLGRSTAAH